MQVESIDQRGATGGRVHVALSDGSSFFVSRELVESLDIAAGSPCTEEQAGSLRRAHLLHEATEKAIELLARAEHSRFLLSRKLLVREFPEAVIADCLDGLEERGLLSDRRFAEEWVSRRIRRRPEGETALIAGLQSRGIDGGLAREVVQRYREECPEEFERAIERAGTRILRRNNVTEREMREKLGRRGFGAGDISLYIESISEELSGS